MQVGIPFLFSKILAAEYFIAKRKSALIFCVNITHVKALTGTFRRYGVDARYLYASTPAEERRALVQSFKNGEYPVLVNCCKYDLEFLNCLTTHSRTIY